MYGEFRGRLQPLPSGTRLEGEFLAYSVLKLTIIRWFAYLWAGLVLFACIFDWQGPKSAVFLVVALVAVALGYGVPKFYEMNVGVEADLLFNELQTELKGRRV